MQSMLLYVIIYIFFYLSLYNTICRHVLRAIYILVYLKHLFILNTPLFAAEIPQDSQASG